MKPFGTSRTSLDEWGPEVARLHRETIVIDSHNDAIVRHIVRRLSFLGDDDAETLGHEGPIQHLRERHEKPVQLNVPLMRAGGLDVAYCAVDCTFAWKNHMSYALDGWGWLANQVATAPDRAVLAGTADELLAAKAAEKAALVLTLENSDGLEKSLNTLAIMHRIGVRAITITWNERSWAGDGQAEAATGGLTQWGRSLVTEMNRLGMLVDISHASERTFWDTLAVATAPLIATHSSCRAMCDHPRNLTDKQLRAIADNGGVIGITWVPEYIDSHQPTLDRLLDHFDHAIQTAGIDHVGLGSDFAGGGDLIRDASQIPGITAGLLQRGYQPTDVKKILGENHLRLFRRVCG